MKRIAELIVRTAELVEAEGRTLLAVSQREGNRLRQIVATMAIGLVFVAVAVPVMIAGFGLIVYGILIHLNTAIGPAGSAIVTGVAALAVSAGCLYIFKRTSER